MGTDRLLASSSERIDLGDFDFLANLGLNDESQQLGSYFFTDVDQARSWILRGFAASNPAGTQIQVDRGVAFLSRRENGVISRGMLTTEGDATKIIDVATFTTGVSYTVYVRFQFADGDLQGRAFWDSSSGQEYTQTVATRRVAGWSMRIEATNPGSEWLPVATFTLAVGPSITALTDVRPFYFEGKPDDAYVSDWSTDADPDSSIGRIPTSPLSTNPTWPGGSGATATVTTGDTSEIAVGDFIRSDASGDWYKITAIVPSTSFTIADVHGHGGTYPSGALASSIQTDRGSDRKNDGVFDLQRFTAATRQCLEDLKGRGLRRWWDRDIGGINIGFDADPVEDLAAVGDLNFGLDGTDLAAPSLVFNDRGAGSESSIFFTRSSSAFTFQVSGIFEASLLSSGFRVLHGLVVGHTGTPVDDVISIGNGDFALQMTGNPTIKWDANDSIDFVRASNRWRIILAAAEYFRFDSLGMQINFGGLSVGHTGAPATKTVSIGDANFRHYFDSTDPYTYYDSNDYLTYDRSENELSMVVGSSTRIFKFSTTKRPWAQIFNPGLYDSQTNPSTSTDFVGGSITIPDADLIVGQVYRAVLGGYSVNVGTATYHQAEIWLNSSLVATAQSTNPQVGASFSLELTFHLTSKGAAGNVDCRGLGHYEGSGGASAVETAINGARVTTNTTSGITIKCACRVGGGNASDIIRGLYFSVERVG